jgi:hypothetical protein
VPDDDRESHPRTEAFVPDFDDTGSQPIPQSGDDTEKSEPSASKEQEEEPEAPSPAAEEDSEPSGAPVQSVTVPGRYQYLKWWKLALVILGVWIATGEIGLSLSYWWYHTIDKTPAVFMVLVYVVVCVVAGVMLAMVQGRPLISALSIAVMSGPFASVTAAAPLYGHYYCARVGHCLIGIIPY